ncbi:MAG TPA: glycosyltransferase family 4 protein [Gemmataceae bacterium]|nr:glycosyltransferase family 4 protein [Gemmataceae bacterium]
MTARSSINRLRIALVVHDYHRHGGHARYTAELATRFRRDHDVHVFSNTVDDSDTAGITFHRVPAWRINALSTIVSFVLPATAKVRGHFDIVHAQGLCGLRQDVVTAHACQPAWFAAADRCAGRPRWRKRVFRALITPLERLAFRPGAAARVIAPSSRVRDDLAAHCGLRDGVRVVPHGTDSDAFHPRNRDIWRDRARSQLGLHPEDVVALYVGDLQKAMPPALQALALTPGVKLVAVSRTDPAPYSAEAAVAGVADRVLFVPPTANISWYYAAADLFLFPSYYDTFGLVVTEAMASGLPVVTSRVVGAAELISDGTDGLLIERPWDAEMISNHLARLRDDPALRERLGIAARRKIEPLTWDRTAEQTLAVYFEILDERKR